MNRRHTTPRSDSIPASGRTELRRRLRPATMLLLSLAFLLGPALGVPKTGSIEITKSSPQIMQYRFSGNKPQTETLLEFKGDGQDWSFVYFDKLPANASLRVKDQLDGYGDSEAIQAEKWYWFKNRLPLILEIKESALTPVNIYFWFGSVRSDIDKEQARELKAEDMRAFAWSHEIKQISQKMTLNFSWEATGGGAGPATTETANVSNANNEGASPPPQLTWWKYLTETQPELGIIVLLITFGLLIFLVIYVIPNTIWRIRDSIVETRLQFSKPKHKMRVQAPTLPKAKPAAAQSKPAAEADLYASLGSDWAELAAPQKPKEAKPESTPPVVVRRDKQTASGKRELVREESNLQHEPDDVLLSPSKPVAQTAAPVPGQDGNKLTELQDRLAQLEYIIGQKVDRQDKLTQAAWTQVNGMLVQVENGILTQVEKTIRQSVGSVVKPLEDFMTEQSAAIEKRLNETVSSTQSSVQQMREEGKGVKEQLAGLVAKIEVLEQQARHQLHTPYDDQKQVREELERLKKQDDEYAEQLVILLETEVRELRKHLAAMEDQQAKLEKTQQARAEEMKNVYAKAVEGMRAEITQVRAEMKELLASSAQVPDSFYVRMLGEVLGQNVEELQTGNFERLSRQVGERVNRFFGTEVSRGDALRELRQRAEAVNSALKEVAAQMQKSNARAAEEAVPYLKHAQALADELAELQTQLQSRRLNVETKLRVPVSIHANARKSFLEELARGIRREIDKLSEPDSHFSGELKHLITTDLIAVVDICDKKIAHPGANSELEASLKKLFAQSRLLPIMPRVGEPFKAAEHDMLQKVAGGTGRSLTIAQVVTRGFYYKHGENETLLRKAGVTVYR